MADNCPIVTPKTFAYSNPVIKPTVYCSDVLPPNIPNVYISPSAVSPPTNNPLNLPPPIIVGNDTTNLDCATDLSKIGCASPSSVTLSSNTYQVALYFQDILDINASQLSYLYVQGSAYINSILVTLTETSLVNGLKLSPAQADFIISFVNTQKAALNAQALDTLESIIDCHWNNTSHTVTCDTKFPDYTPSLTSYSGTDYTVVYSYTVSAGVVSSTVSQSDADTQAINLGNNYLQCLWTNTEQTITCADTSIPVDEDALPNGNGKRVGSVTVNAGLYFSNETFPDSAILPTGSVSITTPVGYANALSEQFAFANLNCFYANNSLFLACDSTSPPKSTATQSGCLGESDEHTTQTYLADIANGIPGNPVVMPSGWFISYTSQADSDAQALSYANSLLSCQYGNTEQTVTCPAVDIDTITYYPSEANSPIYSVVVAADTIFSDISQADANEQAVAQGEAQLICMYCNTGISPLCVPTSETTVPVPLADYDSTIWSVDATRGIASGVYCSEIPGSAQVVALTYSETKVATLLSGSPDCQYGNDKLFIYCAADADNTNHIYGKFPSSQRLVLDVNSTPPPQAADVNKRYVVVGANTTIVGEQEVATLVSLGQWTRPMGFDATIPDAKIYANELALSAGLGETNCYYSNDGFTQTCDDKLGAPSGIHTTWTDFGVTSTASDVWSGSPISVTVPAGMFTSVNSKTEAATYATTYANSSLNCYYTNATVMLDCQGTSAEADENIELASNDFKAVYYNTRTATLDGVTTILYDIVKPRWKYAGATSFDLATWGGYDPVYTPVDDIMMPNPPSPTGTGLWLTPGTAISGVDGSPLLDQNGNPIVASSYTPVRLSTTSKPFVIVPSGTATSQISQEDANVAAISSGRDKQKCSFTNWKDCVSYADFGDGPGVCSDGSSASPGVVAAGTMTSDISSLDAMNQAYSQAQGLSTCAPGGNSGGRDGKQTDCSGTCNSYYS